MNTIHCVGAGGYATMLVYQASLLAKAGGCTLGGVVIDPKVVKKTAYAEQVARVQAQGWKIFPTLSELIDSFPSGEQVLLLPVPIHLHLPFVKHGLEAGYKVVCEKPVAGSLEEANQIYHIMVSQNAVDNLYFGYQNVLGPGFREVRRVLQCRELGELTSISVHVLWPRTLEYYTRNSWAGRLEVEGKRLLDSPIQNAMAHFVQAILLSASDQGYEPTRVCAHHIRAYSCIDSADTQSLKIDLLNHNGKDISAVIAVSHAGNQNIDPEIRWECTKGTINWKFSDQIQITQQDCEPLILPTSLKEHQVYSLPMVAALKGENPNTIGIGFRDAVRHTRVIDAAFRGIDPGNPVPKISDQWVENQNSQLVIRGIEMVLETCSTQGLSLGEAARFHEDQGIGWGSEVLITESPIVQEMSSSGLEGQEIS
jgi:predicted dehydrogenase